MHRVLITGGTGSMGRRLVAKLLSKGFVVSVIALPGDRGIEDAKKAGASVIEADVASSETLAGVCKDVQTVYHLAAVILAPGREEIFTRVNLNGTKNMLSEARLSGVRHFIHVSSASVVYPNPNAYSLSKRASEELVKKSGLPYTIIRPTLAYEDGGAAEFMHYVNFLKRYPVVPLIGGGYALKRPVHVDDIVDGFASLAGNTKAINKTYNFSGGDTLSLREMSILLLSHIGCKKPVLTIPVSFCRLAAWLLNLFSPWLVKEPLFTWQTISGVTQNANLDNSDAVRDLGFCPRTFKEGLETLKSLKKK